MQKIDINLASERRPKGPLPKVAAVLIILAAVFYTFHNIYAYRENIIQLTSYRERVSVLEKRFPAIATGRYPAEVVDVEVLSVEVDFINRMILREAFSWTGVLSDLEEGVPDGVSIVEISPEFNDRKIEISGVARSVKEALTFVDMLGRSGHFKDVFLLRHSEGKGGGVISFSVSAVYGRGTGL